MLRRYFSCDSKIVEEKTKFENNALAQWEFCIYFNIFAEKKQPQNPFWDFNHFWHGLLLCLVLEKKLTIYNCLISYAVDWNQQKLIVNSLACGVDGWGESMFIFLSNIFLFPQPSAIMHWVFALTIKSGEAWVGNLQKTSSVLHVTQHYFIHTSSEEIMPARGVQSKF